MKKSIATLAAVFTLSLLPAVVHAQNPPQTAAAPAQQFYRLHFAVEELNDAGKITNTRTYAETIATSTSEQPAGDQVIRTGSRVPVVSGSFGNPPQTQFQYIDLGVDLHVRDVEARGDSLSFRLNVEINGIANQREVAGSNEPVIRQNSWNSLIIVPLGKPTVVYSSDDLDSTGKMRVQVTATRIE